VARSTPEQREKYKSALRDALIAGNHILQGGGTAMEAAVRAVVSSEGQYSSETPTSLLMLYYRLPFI
jgi:isoaspartyl peptidase/L-asparaginase-like protein (Ntn-hydrolase superfamily)